MRALAGKHRGRAAWCCSNSQPAREHGIPHGLHAGIVVDWWPTLTSGHQKPFQLPQHGSGMARYHTVLALARHQ